MQLLQNLKAVKLQMASYETIHSMEFPAGG